MSALLPRIHRLLIPTLIPKIVTPTPTRRPRINTNLLRLDNNILPHDNAIKLDITPRIIR